MTNYYARVDYTYNRDRIYSIPFSYNKIEDIKVYKNNDETDLLDFTLLTTSQIRLTDTLTENDVITITRKTDIAEKVVNYHNLSMVLNEDNLNKSQDQLLYSAQEVYDHTATLVAEWDETSPKMQRALAEVEQLKAEWEKLHKETVEFREALENGTY